MESLIELKKHNPSIELHQMIEQDFPCFALDLRNFQNQSSQEHVLCVAVQDKVEHLFLASLSRKPTGREFSAIQKILANAKDKPAAALEDIWWALLNSNEFILDH